MRLTTYDSAVTLYPGPNGCSVIAAPPTSGRRSSTVTRAPRRARRPAATRPLWPPPTTTTSNGSVTASGHAFDQRAPRVEARDLRAGVLGAFVGAAQRKDRVEVRIGAELSQRVVVERVALRGERLDAADAELRTVRGVSRDEIALGDDVGTHELRHPSTEQRLDERGAPAVVIAVVG